MNQYTKDWKVKIEMLPTRGALAVEMKDIVERLSKEIYLGVNAPEKFRFGVEKMDGTIVAAMEATFPPMHGVNMAKFEETLRSEAKDPWFRGRLEEISADLVWGKSNDRVEDNMRDLRNQLTHKRFLAVVECSKNKPRRGGGGNAGVGGGRE